MNTQLRSPKQFVDETALASLLGTSQAVLDHAATTSYECLQTGRLHEAEVISRGLVAADHKFWYYRTLLAVSLQRGGQIPEAISQVDEGLKYDPCQPDLVKLRTVLVHLPVKSSARPEASLQITSDLMPRSMRG